MVKEYIYTILIQPFHCIIYFTFISVAFSLVSIPDSGDIGYSQLAAGLLALLCLKFINDGEKVVRKIFGFQDDNSKTSMAAGAVLGVAAIKNANKMAKSVKTGVATGKTFASKVSKDFKKDLSNKATPLGKLADKVQNTPAFQKAKEMSEGAGAKIDSAKKSVADSGVGRTAKSVSNFANKKITGVKKFGGSIKNSAPGQALKKFTNSKAGRKAKQLAKAGVRRSVDGAVAMLGFAAAYATGDTDMLSAIGYGSAMKKGMDELLTSSTTTNKEDAISTVKDAVQHDEEELSLKTDKLKYCEDAKRNLDESTRCLEAAKKITGTDEYSLSRKKAYEESAEKQQEQFKLNIAKYRALEDNQRFLQRDDGTKYTDEELVTDTARMDMMRARNVVYEEQKAGLRTEDSIAKKVARMKSASVDKDIKAEAKEIESLLRQITARRHLKAQSGHDVTTDQHVSVEDMQFAQQMATVIDGNIQKNFLEHSGLSAQDMYKGFGLENLSRDHGTGKVDTQMEVLLLKLQSAVNQQQQNYAAKGLQASRKTSQAMLGKDAEKGLKDVAAANFDEQVIKGASKF